MDLKHLQSSKFHYPNKMTSSTKIRWVRDSAAENTISMIFPFLLEYAINKLRPSTTKRNSEGNSGKPCLTPRLTLKVVEGVPLMSTAKFADITQPIIQLTVSRVDPTCNKISLNGVQLTLSYAFTRSILRTRSSKLQVLMECSASWVIPMAPKYADS